MNRQKREEALRDSGQSGKPSSQPGRSKQPDREQVRGNDDRQSHDPQKPEREPGKLPLPE